MPRKRTPLIVALLPWQGDGPPTADAVRGLPPIDRALTRIEVFTEGGLQVVDTVEPADAGQEQWTGPSYVGKSTLVWGWMATIRLAGEYADTGVFRTRRAESTDGHGPTPDPSTPGPSTPDPSTPDPSTPGPSTTDR
ncbi:hypothetical protein GCM10009627_03150 [Curtobacterium herbarum]|uniref:Uncharacterized protein n=2 Tax=Curtobacterium herbarum TaxID=150122 RepID=A0ABP4K309_9MICO